MLFETSHNTPTYIHTNIPTYAHTYIRTVAEACMQRYILRFHMISILDPIYELGSQSDQIPPWNKRLSPFWKQQLVGGQAYFPSILPPATQSNDALFPVMWSCYLRFLYSCGMGDQMLKQRMCRKLAREPGTPACSASSELQLKKRWSCDILRISG
jgi:hypothetical protein